MSYLLDTNIVSEARKPKADPNVRGWLESVAQDDLHISVLVLAEIRRGVEKLRPRDAKRAEAFEGFLDQLAEDYADRIIPIDERIADQWGRLDAAADRVPTVDGLLAATAIVYDWTFVTRNTKDVERTGVKVLDPFEKRRARG